MDEAAQRALRRLRDPDNQALAALARLTVEQTTATPLRAIAHPKWVASQLKAVLEAGVRGDLLREWVRKRIASERERWGTEERTLRTFVPIEADEPLRKLLGRPYTPSESLMTRVVDQPAIRGLLGVVLTDTVTRFRKRLSEWDSGMLGGLGKRAAARGKGLFGNVGRNLGGMAENLVEVVKEEVDAAMEGRVGEFVQGATSEAVKTAARYVANPRNSEQFAQMRLAVLDVLLDATIRELATELDKMEPEVAVDVVVAAVRSMVDAEDFAARTEERIAKVMEEAGDGTFGAWLEEVGLREVWTDTTTELLTERLAAVVATEPFEAWWAGLFEA
ncbi:MAG: hypothetical protein KC621_16025 [Myxococcales bacterium]|nr:hypothetical protein [Myxococcales bacterium]